MMEILKYLAEVIAFSLYELDATRKEFEIQEVKVIEMPMPLGESYVKVENGSLEIWLKTEGAYLHSDESYTCIYHVYFFLDGRKIGELVESKAAYVPSSVINFFTTIMETTYTRKYFPERFGNKTDY